MYITVISFINCSLECVELEQIVDGTYLHTYSQGWLFPSEQNGSSTSQKVGGSLKDVEVSLGEMLNLKLFSMHTSVWGL